MPQPIDIQSDDICALDEAVQAISAVQFDPADPDSLAETAMWLRKLTNNSTFLGDLLIEQIKPHHRNPTIDSGYGPQAIVLSPRQHDVFLRANIWPSERDQCFRSSGASTFVYGMPHDHNFSFLTSGYLGPGYLSDYYEYDYEAVAGYEGEQAGLRFIERSALSEGKMQLYRAHLDIHSQIPPEALSVSLNVMHVDPAQSWYDQYGFDLGADEITRVLSPNSTETFLRTAVASGHADAIDLATEFGRSHPSDRMRVASYEALAMRVDDDAARDALWRDAESSGSRMLAATARAKRRALEPTG